MFLIGYIHNMGEIPFRAHLFSESQIQRYIEYCKKEKYSYVHIDATGGILRDVYEKKPIFLYTMMFKNGPDAYNNVPLAHAMLNNHTSAGIGYFFGNLAQSIGETNKKVILPSFFITDFSPAIINAALLAFNAENIINHLNRCWNVVQRKYNTQQLRSLSFIHLCCCHVMKAIARNLTNARIEKKTRRSILYVFAFILCGNDINQLYNALGLVINIFGDPHEVKSKEKLDKMLALQLNVDEESELMLKNSKKYLRELRKRKKN